MFVQNTFFILILDHKSQQTKIESVAIPVPPPGLGFIHERGLGAKESMEDLPASLLSD